MITTKQELEKLYELLIDIKPIKFPSRIEGKFHEQPSGELIEASKYFLIAKELYKQYLGVIEDSQEEINFSMVGFRLEDQILFIKDKLEDLIYYIRESLIHKKFSHDILLLEGTILNCLSAIIFLDLELERLKQQNND